MGSRLAAALDALRIVAAADPDHARNANGIGFSKSDGSLGHRLAAAPETSIRNTALAAQAIALAARYRRQVPTSIRYDLHLTDQPDLFD